MANPQNQPNPKHSGSYISGKDERTQAEKDKQQAAQKHDDKKDASGKPSNKSGGCS